MDSITNETSVSLSSTTAVSTASQNLVSATDGKSSSVIGDSSLRGDQYLMSNGSNKFSLVNDSRSLSVSTNVSTDVSNSSVHTSTASSGVTGNVLVNEKLLKGSTQGGWTDQETLLLLEALELYRDDWNKVSSLFVVFITFC